MKQSLYKLYEKNTPANEAYIITDAELICYLTDYDKYQLTGNNLVIGAIELILNNKLNISAQRLETVVTPNKSGIKKLSKDVFLQGFKNASFLFNIALVISKQIILLENIILENRSEILKVKQQIEDESIEYFSLINELEDVYNQRRLPWLHEFIKKNQISLTYKEGKALFENQKDENSNFTKITEDKHQYDKDTIINTNKTKCEHFYILESGIIEVILDNEKINTISSPGAPLCAEQLLSNSNPVKIFKTKSQTVLKTVSKEKLKKDITLLQKITLDLANKYYLNILALQKTNKSIIEQRFETGKRVNEKILQKKHRTDIELRTLKSDLNNLIIKHKAEYLNLNKKR